MYSGLHLLSVRQFDRAAALFVDALPTFTASELLDYNDFVTLTVIAGTLVLKRPDLKKKVRMGIRSLPSSRPLTLPPQIISSPEVNQVLPEIPALSDFTKSLYNCDYAKFFVSLGTVFSHCCLWLIRLRPDVICSRSRANVPHTFPDTISSRTLLRS